MGNQNIIELNGQRYDARTGAIITSTPVASTKKTKPAKLAPGQSMDGFARAPKKSLQHRRPEKSKTLMRTVVSKPQTKATKPDTAQKHAAATPDATPKRNLGQTTRAAHIPKSPLVSKFGSAVTSASQVSPAPKAHSAPTTETASKTKSITDQALARAVAHDDVSPKAKKTRIHARVAHKLRVSPRLVSGALFAFAFIALGGFFMYQNIPGLTMRLAAARSGVDGSLPGYQPAGFRLNGSIAYKPGQITIHYKSNSDDRNFRISQSASQWDSQSLLDNFVAVNRRDYQTIQDKGKTVYIYENSNATWVDAGIWYKIEGQSSLNSNQLLSIAASL